MKYTLLQLAGLTACTVALAGQWGPWGLLFGLGADAVYIGLAGEP